MLVLVAAALLRTSFGRFAPLPPPSRLPPLLLLALAAVFLPFFFFFFLDLFLVSCGLDLSAGGDGEGEGLVGRRLLLMRRISAASTPPS